MSPGKKHFVGRLRKEDGDKSDNVAICYWFEDGSGGWFRFETLCQAQGDFILKPQLLH